MYLNALVIFKSISQTQYVLKYHCRLNKCNSEKSADFRFPNLQALSAHKEPRSLSSLLGRDLIAVSFAVLAWY